MIDPESLGLGGLGVTVVGFVARNLWAAREKRIDKNETDLEALRAAETADLKADVNKLKERLEGVAASHRADIEELKRSNTQLDTRLAFREGKYGAEPLTNPNVRPSAALQEYRAKKAADED